MDITISEKIYKTTFAQRNACYRYAFFNREKVNEQTRYRFGLCGTCAHVCAVWAIIYGMVKVLAVNNMYGLCTISGNSSAKVFWNVYVCVCVHFLFWKTPLPYQNSGHVLKFNLLTVCNKHSWGWLCLSQSKHLELKFVVFGNIYNSCFNVDIPDALHALESL